MKISVIVPIYNAEDTLNRCVDSIVNQTYSDLEVILVDDGSTDSSLEVANTYLADSRVKVFHKPNGGLSHTRNYGMEQATGDFIAFVDSDDWVELDIYEHGIQLFEKYDCDIVDYLSIFKYNDTESTPVPEKYEYEVIEKENLKEDYLYKGQTQKMPFSVCRKIYAKKVIKDVRFEEGMQNEDIVFNFEVLPYCKRLVHTNKIGYNYYQSPNSMTRGGLREKDFDLLKACQYLEDMSRNDNEKVKYLVEVKYARSYFSLMAKIAFYGVADPQLNEKEVTKELTAKLRENYRLLMKSPMPINRKMMVTALAMDIRVLRTPLNLYKKIKR